MLSVRNSCYERKGKARSFMPLTSEDLPQQRQNFFNSPLLIQLLSDLGQRNNEAALKLPFSMVTIRQSQALNALS